MDAELTAPSPLPAWIQSKLEEPLTPLDLVDSISAWFDQTECLAQAITEREKDGLSERLAFLIIDMCKEGQAFLTLWWKQRGEQPVQIDFDALNIAMFKISAIADQASQALELRKAKITSPSNDENTKAEVQSVIDARALKLGIRLYDVINDLSDITGYTHLYTALTPEGKAEVEAFSNSA